LSVRSRRSLKRDIHGESLFCTGLVAVIWGLLEANWPTTLVKVSAGLVLLVMGLSIIFSKTNTEAGIHTREVFEKVVSANEKSQRVKEYMMTFRKYDFRTLFRWFSKNKTSITTPSKEPTPSIGKPLTNAQLMRITPKADATDIERQKLQ